MTLKNRLSHLLNRPSVKALFKALEPFEVRLVGGCVRDALLGGKSIDIDLAVAALPQEITQHLRQQGIKVVPTGIEFGTVTAVMHHQGFQLTSLRQDVKTDGRHAQVSFGTNWLEDAKRRDFTINALSLDVHGTLYDYFNGQDDLKAGHIRFIGDAEQRIREDYLRILRYYRFLAYFGKDNIIPIPALTSLCSGLKQLSIERIQQEILKLLAAADPRMALKLMKENGVFDVLYDQSVEVGRLCRLIQIELSLALPVKPLRRLWALFYDQNVDFYDTFFRLSHEQQRFLKTMSLSMSIPNGFRNLDSKIRIERPECTKEYMRTRESTIFENQISKGEGYKHDKKWILYKHGYCFFESWCVLQACTETTINLPRLKADLDYAQAQPPLIFPLTGKDLLAQGMPAGPAIGNLLRTCEQWWVENNFRPSYEECLAYCQDSI